MPYRYGNHFIVNMPREAIDDLSSPGPVDSAAAYWARKIPLLDVSDDTLRDELYETGIGRERIDEMDRDELVMYVLWVLAGQELDDEHDNEDDE